MSGTLGTQGKTNRGKKAPLDMPEDLSPLDVGPAVIEATGLGRRFGKKWVVRDLDLSVQAGSVTALLGRNGAGKSTTIQMLLGLLPPSEGTVRVLGLDPRADRTKLFEQVGYVSERRELLEDQTVDGLARIVADIHGGRFDLDRFQQERTRYRLEREAKCANLSKGQRARLLLALALCANPRLLVLDEPTSGLDVVVRDDFLEGIAEFAASEERAVLLSSHLIEDVGRICDRAIVLRPDGTSFQGEIEEMRRSCSRYLVRLEGVVPRGQPLALPKGAVLLERDPRALTIVAPGAAEHFEAAIDAALPVAGVERQPASLKEAFTCLTDPGQEGTA